MSHDHHIRSDHGVWRDPSGRARAAVWTLTFVLVMLLVDVLWSAVGIAAVGGLYLPPDLSWYDRFDAVWAWLGRLYLVGLIFAAAAFIRWERQLIRNTAALDDVRPSPGPGAAAVQWFIPIASLFLPLSTLRDLARANRPPERPPADGLLLAWWGCWVVANLALSLISVVLKAAEGHELWIGATAADAVATLLLIGAGVLAMRVVRVLTAWQVERATAVAASPPEPVPTPEPGPAFAPPLPPTPRLP